MWGLIGVALTGSVHAMLPAQGFGVAGRAAELEGCFSFEYLQAMLAQRMCAGMRQENNKALKTDKRQLEHALLCKSFAQGLKNFYEHFVGIFEKQLKNKDVYFKNLKNLSQALQSFLDSLDQVYWPHLSPALFFSGKEDAPDPVALCQKYLKELDEKLSFKAKVSAVAELWEHFASGQAPFESEVEFFKRCRLFYPEEKIYSDFFDVLSDIERSYKIYNVDGGQLNVLWGGIQGTVLDCQGRVGFGENHSTPKTLSTIQRVFDACCKNTPRFLEECKEKLDQLAKDPVSTFLARKAFENIKGYCEAARERIGACIEKEHKKLGGFGKFDAKRRAVS